MLGQASPPNEDTSIHLCIDPDPAALSQNVASLRSHWFLQAALGFAILMLIGVSACALHALAPHASAEASAEASHFAPELAFKPMPSLGSRGIHPARYPESGYKQPPDFLHGSIRRPRRQHPAAALLRGPWIGSHRDVGGAPGLSMQDRGNHADDQAILDLHGHDSVDQAILDVVKSGHDEVSSLSDSETVLMKNMKLKTVLKPGRMRVQTGVAVLPHPDKVNQKYAMVPHCGGEDSFFIEDSSGVVGVADGVGSWVNEGIDPGMYSRQLMKFAAEEARDDGTFNLQNDPGEILQRAQKRTYVEGSSTALILAFSQEQAGEPNPTWKVKATNLGDSGFVHLRSGKVLFQSTPQLHSHNYPFQLSAPGGLGDSPTEAQTYELHDVLEGDVFVLGTDGLFDNAFGKEIAHIVHRAEVHMGQSSRSFGKKVADEIALWAVQGAAMHPDRITPYAHAALMDGRFALGDYHHDQRHWIGGKLDDITVVVVVVGAEGKPTETSEAYSAYMDPEVKVAPRARSQDADLATMNG